MTKPKTARVILLRPRNPGPNIAAWAARPRRIQVLTEAAQWWNGPPLANPKCPPLLWPKFAWEEVPCQPKE